MENIEAIKKITEYWGISEPDRIFAIRVVLSGNIPPEKVVAMIEEMSMMAVALHSLEIESGVEKT